MFIKYFTVGLSIHAAIGKVIVETFGSESIEDGPFGGNIDGAKKNLVYHMYTSCTRNWWQPLH